MYHLKSNRIGFSYSVQRPYRIPTLYIPRINLRIFTVYAVKEIEKATPNGSFERNYVSPSRGIRFVLHGVSDLLFDLGVTSRDLSMTLTVFKRILRKWTLAPKLLGLEWCNLGKS